MVFNNSILLGAAGQSGTPTFDTTLISNSVWLDGSADGLTAPSSTFSAQDGKEFTLGTWFQLNQIGVSEGLFCAGANPYTALRHDDDNKIYFQTEAGTAILKTQALFRDIGWYHVLLSVDTTQSIASNRVKLFVNGTEQTLDGTQPSVNHAYEFNTAVVHEVGDSFENGAFKGYLAQSFMIGSKSIQQGDFAITDFLDTFTFGTNGSQFIPKKHSEIKTLVDAGSSNSFLLQYENSSALGTDSSTNTNTFTATSMGSANQSNSTPSLVYPIVNALTKVGSASSTLEEGNTKATVNDNGGIVINPTLPFSGLWYFEINVTTNAAWYPGIGQQSALGYNSTAAWNNTTAETHVWLSDHSGNYFNNNGSLSTYPIANPTTGRFAVAWDGDNRALYFGQISGSTITWTNSGDPTSGSSKTGAAPGNWPTTGNAPLYFIVIGGGTSVMEFDFDEDDWTGSTNRPAAAKALNSANLTTPDYQGIDYFDATLYEGNGTGQRVGDFVPFTDSETVANSTIFNDDDSAYLTRTYVTPTAATTFTFACWFKPGSSTGDLYIISTGTDSSSEGYIAINNSTGGGQIWIADPNAGSGNFGARTSATFSDSSQWYHLCIGIDSTAGSGSRFKLEVNGVEQTMLDNLGGGSLPTEPSSSQSMKLNGATDFTIGRRHRTSGEYFDGYLANVYFIDGEKKQASDFGQLDTSTNRWVSKAYSGSYGNNGFKLAFGTASTGNGNTNGVGTDTSGEGHNWTEQGFTTSDQVIDSPSQNFATIDPVISNGATPVTLSDGNLTGVRSASGFQQAYSSFSGFRLQENTGIYFAEVLMGADSSNFSVGVLSGDPPSSTNRYLGQDSNTYGYAYDSGNKVNNGTGASYGATYTSGDVIGIEIDTDTGSINFHKNGSDQGQAFTAVPGPYSFAFDTESGGGPNTFNFGQQMVLGGASTTFNATAGGRFKHTPPTGAKALNQDNLDDTASKITAWAWIKNRDATDNHILVDRVRGVGKDMHSNNTDAEATNLNTVQRFLQRGVQIGSDVEVNTANESYVLWQWLLGDSATTGSSITTGSPSLTTTGIVAAADHFSILSYTGNATGGATIAHGMSAAPEMIVIKERDNANGWIVGSDVVGYTKILRLDTTDASTTDSGAFNDTAPSATLITLGSNNGTNRSSGKMICYAFRSIPGVCKVGKYIGNGNNNGVYVNLGFKPRWVMVKGLAASRNWNTLDTARNPVNVASPFVLLPNDTLVDTAGQIGAFDILSDGFKPRDTAANSNASGETYLYMAMADIGGNGTLPPIYGR